MILTRHLRLMSADLKAAWTDFSWTSPKTRMALKTALACVSAILITYALNFSDGFWAGISAVIMMKPNVGATFQKAWMRAGGAVAGSALSIVVTSLFVQDPLGFSVSIFLIITAGFYLGATRASGYFWSYMFGHMALISMISVMEPGITLEVVVTRSVAVSIGVIISCIVHTLLWPEYAHETLYKNIHGLEDTVFRFIHHIMEQYLSRRFDATKTDAAYRSLLRSMAGQRQLAELTRYERTLFGRHLMIQSGRVETLERHTNGFMEFYRSAVSEADDRYVARFTGTVSGLMSRLSEWMDLRDQPSGARRRVETEIRGIFQQIHSLQIALAETREERLPILSIMLFYEGMHFLNRFFVDLSSPAVAATPQEEFGSSFPRTQPGDGDDRFFVRHIQAQLPVLQYAIKGGLGILLLFWVWLWAEIPGGGLNMSVAVITVLQIDLMSTYQRGMLRFLGCFLGAALGLLLLGFQVDNTLVMSLIAFWAIFPLAYIWASGPNAAYIGAQAAIALIITLFPDKGPATTLAPVIERLVGIFLAVLFIWILNLLLWPQDLTERLDDLLKAARKRLLGLRDLIDRFYRGESCERPSDIDAIDLHLIGAVIDTLEEQREVSPEEAALIRKWVSSLNELFDEATDLMACGGPHLTLIHQLRPDLGQDLSKVLKALAVELPMADAHKNITEMEALMEATRDMAEQLRDLTHGNDTRFKVHCSLTILAVRRVIIGLKRLWELEQRRSVLRQGHPEEQAERLGQHPLSVAATSPDSV
jgi:uncharacterized membrane protein YccC